MTTPTKNRKTRARAATPSNLDTCKLLAHLAGELNRIGDGALFLADEAAENGNLAHSYDYRALGDRCVNLADLAMEEHDLRTA